MKKSRSIIQALSLLLFVGVIAACGENHTATNELKMGDSTEKNISSFALTADSPEVGIAYARQLSTIIAGRPLTLAERSLLKKDGQAALKPLLKTWLEGSFFPQSFRIRVDMMLSTSGTRDGVDMNLPGNLAEYIAKNKLPIETLLTADFCVDAKGAKIKCDTGAPFNAGVIGTRGFLLGHAGRFNLGRANSMLNSFACTQYPMSTVLQPPTPKAELIPNFQISTKEEAEKTGAGQFGNGLACYSCHSQFSTHTQLFVKFDDKGVYQAMATGVQSKSLEFGRADGGLYASHFADASRSADEKSNMFGSNVSNLAEAMRVLSDSKNFKECMTGKVIIHALNLDSEAGGRITAAAVTEIAKSIPSQKPSVNDFYLSILTHPLVIAAYAKGLGADNE